MVASAPSNCNWPTRTLHLSDKVSPSEWPKLIGGVLVVFAVFHGAATLLGSDRGQAGLPVCLLVVAATLGFERLFFQRSLATSAQALGLSYPTVRGLLTAAVLCALLLLVFPLFAYFARVSLAFYPGAGWLLVGLFAQAGIAEETLFRGYLFGRLRRRHSFWRAAALATLPFVAVHLVLFATLPWPIALAAMLLSVALSFPLAHLFELSGGTIWASALVHFVVQGAIKLVVPEAQDAALPLVWMAASATVPFLAFLVPRRAYGAR